MSQDTEERLDALLNGLAREERSGWPEASVALVERVLADAGVAVGPAPVASRPEPQFQGLRRVLAFLADGWGAGAVAAMLAGLTIGLGIGLEREVDLFDANPGPASEFSLADSGVLGDDTLF